MTLDVYRSAHDPRKWLDATPQQLRALFGNQGVIDCIAKFRAGDKSQKRNLPAICFMGHTTSGHRDAESMTPTGLCMLDIDHADDKLPALIKRCSEQDFLEDVRPALIHITPSGKGLRIVYPFPSYCENIVEAQTRIVERYNLQHYGVFDSACKDISRLSFVPQAADIILLDDDILFHDYENTDQIRCAASDAAVSSSQKSNGDPTDGDRGQQPISRSASDSDGTHAGSNAGFQYNNIPVQTIAEEYVKWKGEPQEGETHNFFNAMVADFRHICNNSPAVLIDVLPLFGQTREERMRQCESICKRNTATKIPGVFWRWLRDKGYWQYERPESAITDEDQYAEEKRLLENMPPLPPVFREYISIAPPNFKIPVLFGLLPVMGTLATYLAAEFYDGEIHTPSFFTIIYAPPGQGKSFVNRFLNTDVDRSGDSNLLDILLKRDIINDARNNLWIEFSNTKKDNEKGKSRPKTTTRILPPIFSQADFLPVMKGNQGMHMFCFAPEIDTFIKGMKAGGGGDKSDIFRTAWDNGVYGQSYRGANSFRGKVALYLNILTTGTPAQCARLFTDVENGLVTRCSFTDLGDQNFAAYQPWKKLSKKDLKVISAFRDRCDVNTYTSPLSFDYHNLDEYEGDEEKFDENVHWEYQFRGRQLVDLDYINNVLLKWVEEQRLIAQKNSDLARDAFRKRSAVRAFRLALLCHACWAKVGDREKEIIKNFILWFAELDLYKCLKRWSADYNEKQLAVNVGNAKTSTTQTLFDSLNQEFTTGDLALAATKSNMKTPAGVIICRWKKAGLITKTANKTYAKVIK